MTEPNGHGKMRKQLAYSSWSFYNKRGNRDLIKEDTRKQAELAIQAFSNDSTSLSTAGAYLDNSSRSNVSVLSHEQAIRRGSQLGSFEMNESEELDVPRRLFHDDSISTLPEAIPDAKKKRSPRFFGKSKKGLGKKKNGSRKKKKNKEQSDEEWMCGVCARSFSSYEAAERHEEYHIREVVVDLGWTAQSNSCDNETSSNNLSNSSRSDGFRTPERRPLQRTTLHNDTASKMQPRPDILSMSSPVAGSKRFSVQPYTPTLQRNTTKPPRKSSLDSVLNTVVENEEFKLTAPIPETPHLSLERSQHLSLEHNGIGNDGDKVQLVLADEALVDVCSKAESLILTRAEIEAESELEWLAKDKAYYDLLSKRAIQRRRAGRSYLYRQEGTSALATVQNKFVDAYQLMKEGKESKRNTTLDYYTRKLKGNAEEELVIDHTQKTLYVNVMVKNSFDVVRHELERLAKKRWEDSQLAGIKETDIQRKRFQQFRTAAQGNLVKLARYALASDFTPRRIAVQLSNDLYRLLTPRLKRRGVEIETEIEYRVGAYFVLAVNIKSVHWRRLVKRANRDVVERQRKWSKEHEGEESENDEKKTGILVPFLHGCLQLTRLQGIEILAHFLAWMYYFHWIIQTPICFILYHLFPNLFRRYFLSSVADEIFYYVEQKGMRMDIGVRDSSTQAAFMLSALREMRAGEQKKKQEEGEAESQIAILGPLLGPAIKGDKNAAPPCPENVDIPANLDFVGLELDVPVGFKRLRWALLSSRSTFMTEAVFRAEAKYENIESASWSKFDDIIGEVSLPDGTTENDLIGTEKETSYLMPKSAFVKANMAYETGYIEAYNDYCFCIKKKALTPDVPYGNSFVAWTKFVVINTGSNSCKMILSVEAEFPNGPPMISRQIQSGMKAGVGELFVKIGETVTKYADEFP